MEPTPFHPLAEKEGLHEKGSLFATSPFDIRGVCGLRIKYISPDRPDEMVIYIPALRRIRRLPGTNSQDPIIGTDYLWDDWRGWWQKLSSKILPWKVELIGEGVTLSPFAGVHYFELKDEKIYVPWEKRPVWIIKMTSQDPKYIYGYRILYVDKELFRSTWHIMGDQKMRVYKRDFMMCRWHFDGRHDWYGYERNDLINRHRSIMQLDVSSNQDVADDGTDYKEDWFNIRFLSRYAR
jgi:hypothetical protein